MLEASEVWFRYGRGAPWVLEDVEVAVAPGDVVGVRGPSGRGKTTLGRVLCGYLEPQRGAVRVDGVAPGPGRHPVQLVAQHPELAVDPRWRLAEILGEAGAPDPALLYALSVDEGWLDRFPHELSGGELQRVAVARALAGRPRYVVADEVSAMLDPITQAQIWDVLLRRVREDGLGLLAVCHDDALLDVVADRVVNLGAPIGAVASRPSAIAK